MYAKKIKEAKTIKHSFKKTANFLKSNIDILEHMISDITGLDYSLVSGNIKLKTKDSQKSNTIFLIEFDREENIIIELNKNSYENLVIKNLICLLAGIENNHQKRKDNLKLVQIHLNYEKNCKKEISKYRIKEHAKNNTYQSFLCIEICPINCRKLYEKNKSIDNAIKWGTFFDYNREEEIDEILNNLKTKKEYKNR